MLLSVPQSTPWREVTRSQSASCPALLSERMLGPIPRSDATARNCDAFAGRRRGRRDREGRGGDEWERDLPKLWYGLHEQLRSFRTLCRRGQCMKGGCW